MDVSVFEEVVEELVTGFQPGSHHWVIITHVNSPQNFYLRPEKYEEHLKLLESHIKMCVEQNIDPKIQELVFYRAHERGGKTIRGRVVGIHQTEFAKTFEIFAMDYGYVDKEVELKDIFACDEDVAVIPPLAFNCQMKMCAPAKGTWNENSLESFKFLLEQGQTKMVVKHNLLSKLTIELFNNCPDELGKLLSMTGFSTWGYMPFSFAASKKEAMKFYYNHKDRSLHETLTVQMLQFMSMEEFYVAEVGEQIEYLQFRKKLKEYPYKNIKLCDTDLVPGRPVLLKQEVADNPYERALVEHFSTTSDIGIFTVDTGKRITVEKTQLKTIPNSLREPPVTAICCRATELPAGLTKFTLGQPGYQFFMTITAPGFGFQNPHTVKIKKIE